MESEEKKRSLNEKQETFCMEYIKDLNATKAAIRAGYTKNVARNTGPRLLKSPAIVEKIQELMEERAKRTKIDSDRVLKELATIAFVNIADIINVSTGEVSPTVDMEKMRAVASIKVKTGATGEEHEIKLVDKLKALEMLCRHLGLNNPAKSEEEQTGGVVEIPAVSANVEVPEE